MYLEISARRTGKTSRLLKEFENSPLNSFIVVPYMSLKYSYPEYTRNRVITVDSLAKPSSIWSDGYVLRADAKGKIIAKDYRLLWDEFDLSKDGSDYIKQGDYYVTTPNTLRGIDEFLQYRKGGKDMLLRLVDICEHKYAKYAYSDAPFLEESKQCLPSSEYIKQHEGKFEISFKDCTGGIL